MRAVVMRAGGLVVDDVDVPRLQAGQVLAEVLACGICGSDLHALHHADRMVEMSELASEPGGISPEIMDPSHDVVMGHEFSARVLEVGENVGNCTPGDVVVSLPIVMDAGGIHAVGYSNDYPGGYGEQLVLSDMLTMKVPDGLDPELAALTEPMAVGLHAVEMSRVTPRHAAVVLGYAHAGQTQLGQFGHHVPGAATGLGQGMSALEGVAFFHPARHGIAQRVLIVGEVEVHRSVLGRIRLS